LVKGFLKLKLRLKNFDLFGALLGFLSLFGSWFEERLLLAK
jgi:hypothetical protein